MIDLGYPRLTADQIEQLEVKFPPRCLHKGESVEDHLRYAGKVELIAILRSFIIDPRGLDFTPDEEAAIDDQVEAIAQHQQNGDK